jgi:hypothetical protein
MDPTRIAEADYANLTCIKTWPTPKAAATARRLIREAKAAEALALNAFELYERQAQGRRPVWVRLLARTGRVRGEPSRWSSLPLMTPNGHLSRHRVASVFVTTFGVE